MSLIHTCTRTLLPLLPEFWPTGLRPLAFTHFRSGGWRRTHSLAHKQDQTQSRQMARGQIQRGPLRDAQELRWQQRWGNRVWGGGGSRKRRRRKRMRGATRAFTLGEAWRACSLRRTSRRCCRTPCPSGELLEPCSRGCHWGKHTSTPWEIQKLITSSTTTESQGKGSQGRIRLKNKCNNEPNIGNLYLVFRVKKSSIKQKTFMVYRNEEMLC